MEQASVKVNPEKKLDSMTDLKLNVGVGAHAYSVATPVVFDCFNIDLYKMPNVNMVCDVQHLPFQSKVFKDTFCFHVLEHTENPAKALAELVRVTTRLVEIEVPHWLSRMAKSERWKKGDTAVYHVASFKCMWFHQCLRNYVCCTKILYEFPRDLHLHVWVYIEETMRRNHN